MGRDPLLGRLYLLLGRQNPCYSTMIVICGSPNCVLLCFVGHQQTNVENYCSRPVIPNRGAAAHKGAVDYCQGCRQKYQFLGIYGIPIRPARGAAKNLQYEVRVPRAKKDWETLL